MDKIAKKIAEKIRKQRKVSGMTARQVSEKTDIKRVTFSNIENGNQQVYAHDLWQISKALNCSISDFFPDEELEKIERSDSKSFEKNWSKKLK